MSFSGYRSLLSGNVVFRPGRIAYAISNEAEVGQYELSAPYDLSTATQTATLDSRGNATSGGTLEGLGFSKDGKTLITSNSTNATIDQFSLSTPYDISTATLNDTPASEGSSPTSVKFSSDGTVLIEADQSDDVIREIPLSTPFDVTTKGAVANSLSFTYVTGFSFGDAGTTMYRPDNVAGDVTEIDLPEPFDLSSSSAGATYSTTVSSPSDVALSFDGTRLFISDKGDGVEEAELTTAWDLSTASSVTTHTNVNDYSIDFRPEPWY